jgi:TctA family transporter
VIIALGAYAVRNSIADVLVALIFSLMGYFMKQYDYPRAAVILGVVLGRIFEANLHLSLQLFGWKFILVRPIALIIFFIIVLTLAFQIHAWHRKQGLTL